MNQEERSQKKADFFGRLSGLSTGDRTALKRAAGELLSGTDNKADGKAIAAFYKCLPYGVPQYEEDRWFAVACIYCMWKTDDNTPAKPIEAIFADMKNNDELSDSMAHRLMALLDTEWSEDGYMLTKLCRLVKMVKADGKKVDCSKLLDDLIRWNNDSQSVQRNWARTFYQN